MTTEPKNPADAANQAIPSPATDPFAADAPQADRSQDRLFAPDYVHAPVVDSAGQPLPKPVAASFAATVTAASKTSQPIAVFGHNADELAKLVHTLRLNNHEAVGVLVFSKADDRAQIQADGKLTARAKELYGFEYAVRDEGDLKPVMESLNPSFVIAHDGGPNAAFNNGEELLVAAKKLNPSIGTLVIIPAYKAQDITPRIAAGKGGHAVVTALLDQHQMGKGIER